MRPRSTRASRSAWTNEDSGTQLFLSNMVSSVAAGFRNILGDSVAQDVNVLRCETKARKKLLIIKLSEPRPYALLPGIVLSLNKSTHQA
jgi:hypothetical protein